jgi:hypothetical protein
MKNKLIAQRPFLEEIESLRLASRVISRRAYANAAGEKSSGFVYEPLHAHEFSFDAAMLPRRPDRLFRPQHLQHAKVKPCGSARTVGQ